MSILSLIRRGLGQVVQHWPLLIGLWVANVLFALPAAFLLSEAIESSIGDSLFASTLREGFDAEWFAEFESQAEGGLESTFGPSVIGAGAVLDNLEAWWNGGLFSIPKGLLAFAFLYLLLWIFLLGGLLDHFARARDKASRGGFFEAGSRHFWRFLLLAGMAGVAYFGVYWASRRAFGWLAEATRDLAAEGPLLARVLALAGVTAICLHGVRMVFDYAKIAVVVDGLASHRALAQALRVVASNPVRVLTLYASFGVLALLWLGLYVVLAPGAGQSTILTVLAAFGVGQIYGVGRLASRVGVLGAQLELYRDRGDAEGGGSKSAEN